jgi:hypothetical protein
MDTDALVVTLAGGHRHSNPYPLATSRRSSTPAQASVTRLQFLYRGGTPRLVALALLAWQCCAVASSSTGSSGFRALIKPELVVHTDF